MKKVEVTKVGKAGAFKATLYILSIPMAFMFLIGLIFIIVGLSDGNGTTSWIGLSYLIGSIVLLFFHGGLNVLITLVYNLFAKKYGGFEFTLKDKGSDAANK